ncbi:MAG: hypothetical protein KF826_14695 [Xanthobacteraceae bacterium]|nr:hypothetical protein [Xanthobacteraceae bacterium]MBX3535592.1 hypothetical protein [Xanthobacteraceae bacterium]MCW5678469.1 hypothetical protein [Xanthobacteraceae bacterium]
MTASDIQIAAQAAQVVGPSFWLLAIIVIAQTVVFSIVGTWVVSRFIGRLISDIRKEIHKAVAELTSADAKVAKETGDSIQAMRQHVSNVERDTEKRCHAIEKKALEDRAEFLEHFVRRDSFLHVTQKIESVVEKLDAKIDEIRDRLPAARG